MANKFARSNGDFNDASIWSLSATGLSATTVPTIGDNAIANTFTIQITGNVACDNITNGVAYGGTEGGSFSMTSTNETQNLSANITGYAGSSQYCLSATGTQNINIFGNIVAFGRNSVSANGMRSTTTGSILIKGNVTGGGTSAGGNGYGLWSTNNSSLSVTGNVSIGYYAGHGIYTETTGPIIVNGDIGGSGGGNSGQNTYALLATQPSQITVYGNVAVPGSGNSAAFGLVRSNTSPITIFGNVVGSAATNGTGVANNTAGNLVVYGNVVGGTGVGLCISNTSTGSVTVYGNLNGAAAAGLANTSTGSITVLGNITADSRGGNGITSTNAAANVKISGNLISAPNGIPAVYAAAYTVNPIPSQTYIRYANNGTGVGSDAYLYHYTTDSLSAFSMPPVSAVRAGLQYADNTLTGTCEIPAVSAVTFGALVDNTSGTAVLTNNTLFDVSVASLTATDSLGARLKNSATVESVGRIIASF